MENNRIVIKPLALTVALSLIGSAGAVGNGTVVSGTGNIVKSGELVNVNQSSNKMIIKWDNMNVGEYETLNFKQAANASVLNRINSIDPTVIAGALNATGNVFVVNPNGVLISNGAAVNVGSLVASSLDIRDSDFNAGNYNFIGSEKGKVVNKGKINAQNSVALIGAGEVANSGSISAAGNASLAAGSDITLMFPAMGKIAVKVNKGSLQALINNGGMVISERGMVTLSAWATDTLTRGVINNTGVLEATGFSSDGNNGISLSSLGNGQVNLAGRLGAQQGNINITSNTNVKLVDLSLTGKQNTDITAQGDVDVKGYLYADGGLNIDADNITAGSSYDVWQRPKKSVITAQNDINLKAKNAISMGDLKSYDSLGKVTLTAQNIDVGAIYSQGSSSVKAGHRAGVGTVRGGSATLTSGGELNINSVDLNGDLSVASAGDLRFSNLASSGDLSLSAANIYDVKNGDSYNSITSKKSITLSADNKIDIGSITTQFDYNAWYSGRDPAPKGGKLTINGGDVAVKNINAVDDVTISAVKDTAGAKGDIKISELNASGKGTLTALNDIALGSTSTKADLSINAGGTLAISNRLSSQKKLSAKANDIVVNRNYYPGSWQQRVVTIDGSRVDLQAANSLKLGSVTAHAKFREPDSGNVLLKAKDIDVYGMVSGHKLLAVADNNANIALISAGSSFNTSIEYADVNITGNKVHVDGGSIDGNVTVNSRKDIYLAASTQPYSNASFTSTEGNIYLGSGKGQGRTFYQNLTLNAAGSVNFNRDMSINNDLSVTAGKSGVFLPASLFVSGNANFSTPGDIVQRVAGLNSFFVQRNLTYTLSRSSKLMNSWGGALTPVVYGKTTKIVK